MDSSKISAHIKEIASSIFPDIVSVRKWLHMHPELSFKEKETSKYICSILKKNNIYFVNNIGGYGIVATVKGKNPDSKVIAFRADMDALPIEEQNEVDYKKKNLLKPF